MSRIKRHTYTLASFMTGNTYHRSLTLGLLDAMSRTASWYNKLLSLYPSFGKILQFAGVIIGQSPFPHLIGRFLRIQEAFSPLKYKSKSLGKKRYGHPQRVGSQPRQSLSSLNFKL